MGASDVEFFAQRAAEERAAAARSASGTAKAVHAELAERYEAVVRAYRPLVG
jgi:hypothetical protein